MKFVLRCLVLEIARGKGPRKRGGRKRNPGNQKSLDEEQIPMSELFGLQITNNINNACFIYFGGSPT